jgi:hypothetical protein
METKRFYGIEFKVYTDTKIEGDFIHPDEAVYFENDVEITGRLEVKYLKCEKSINVHKSYLVDMWEEVGEYQEVGGSQEVGEYQKVVGPQEVVGYQEIGEFQEISGYQEVGWHQMVGGYQKVSWSQEVGGFQKIGKYQEIGESQEVGEYQVVGRSQEVDGYQKIGRSQEIGGNLRAKSARVSLYSKVGGKYDVEGKVFIGVCEWRETGKAEKTLTCGEFVSGDIKYGYLKETGLSKPPEKMIEIDGKKFSQNTIKEALKEYLN